MSKSAGNGIDPVEMIEKYGADAVRYSLMILTREGQDVKLAENRFELGQRFCNKIWNVARFVLQNLQDADELGHPSQATQSAALEDQWILSRLAGATEAVSTALDQYDFHDAAQALYRFTWDDFCDWYVEAAKRRLWDGEGAAEGSPEAVSAAAARATLGHTLSTLLKLLHPFTPFLSEALWAEVPESLRGGEDMLMVASWPSIDAVLKDSSAEAHFAQIQDAVRAIRNVRSLLETPSGDKPVAVVVCGDADSAANFEQHKDLVNFLARLDGLKVRNDGSKPSSHGTDVFRGGSVFLPFTDDTDPAKLRGSLEKKLKKVEGGMRAIDGKLGNEKFLANADPDVVASERERRALLEAELATLQANLEGLVV